MIDTLISRMSLKKLFWATLALALVSRLLFLGHPPSYYFDEVYHGFTAVEYVHGNVATYDPWAKPPPNLAYEWTHPPLAKLIMAIFILVFGENAWGWRLGSVVFSMIVLGFVYRLVRERVSERAAVFSTFFLAVDGSFLTQSRIAMNDVYFMAFLLFALWSYLRWKDRPSPKSRYFWWTGIGIGLALSCKWTALYTFLVIGLDVFGVDRGKLFLTDFKTKGWKWLALCFLAWVVLPLAVYFSSYAHFFWMGWKWDRFVELQRQMWWYHSHLKATHPFQSLPWQWVLNVKPVWMHLSNDVSPEWKRDIWNLGNTVVYWFGLLSVIWIAFFSKRIPQTDAQKTSMNFFIIGYVCFWVPWTFSPRIMFSYHYLPAVPFLCMCLGSTIDRMLDTHGKLWVRLGYWVPYLAAIWFLLFFPFNTGAPIPKKFHDQIYMRWPRAR